MLTSSNILVSASILCADFGHLAEAVKATEAAGTDLFHIDVMDGHFVPNISIGPLIVEAVRKHTKLPLDVHLMIEDPGRYIDAFLDAGADILGIHAECYGVRREACRGYGQWPKEIDVLDADAARADIRRIKERGAQAYLVLNPGTPMCLDEVLEELDGVLVMSVNPGFAKQKFIPGVLDKVRQLRNHPDFSGDIAIDGGINDKTGADAVKAGANILITASYLYGAPDPKEAIAALKAGGR
jgi:ribulose-phosphate 3-epimerase